MDRYLLCTLTTAVVVGYPVLAADPEPGERFVRAVKLEDEIARKSSERLAKPGESERERWFKRLDEVYTGKVPPNPADWFDLVTSGRSEWARDTSRYFAEFHDRICYRLDEKKDFIVNRDGFARYAERYLGPDSPPWKIVDLSDESRAVFKLLDVDRDNNLIKAECTPGLQERFDTADTDKDGKVNQSEYRAYLFARVGYETQFVPLTDEKGKGDRPKGVEATNIEESTEPKPIVYRDAKDLPKELPGWFVTLDTDKDMQVGLYEWAAGKRPVPEFQVMDLNSDGLLEVTEYLRYRKKRAEEVAKPTDLRAAGPGEKDKKKK